MKQRAGTGGEGEVTCKMVFALHPHLSLGTKFRLQREVEGSLVQSAVPIPGFCRHSPDDLPGFPWRWKNVNINDC